jgi:arylsulfatase A-like enzyme
MNRRSFLEKTAFAGAGLLLPSPSQKTEHLIFVVNGGARKKDYYEDISRAPNIRNVAREGFVFEEDHCERIASHDAAFAELLTGREWRAGVRPCPNIFDYLSARHPIVSSLRLVPGIMEMYKPRVLVCRETAHDVGHEDYEEYLRVVRATDAAIGNLFNWIKKRPYFSQHTAIVIRPEFGRDDEVNHQGQLHHSEGFYYTHRVASIFWGPDFNKGVDRNTVISRLDMAPTLAKLFGVQASYTQGRVVPGLLKTPL